ncbi:hypothetical protein [Ferruginibacter sp. SUN106]|uniref:hypothetical protein n=1 Tax=Ferruginibacter sp. SUN106 TaxID=2978348 RepID=UPI003D362681
MHTFSEVQRFRVRWAWLGTIALNGIFLYAIVQQVILGKPFGTRPASNTVLILLEIFFLLLLVFIRSIKLKTTYNSTGIQYRFYPFQFKTTHIEWHELSDAYIREYHSLYEYGGWGIRIGSPKTGRAINTSASCNQGLQLRFRDGKLLLIGTKNPASIQKILDEVIIAGKINRIV